MLNFGEKHCILCYSVHVKYWFAANSNLAYFTELTTALECQKQLLMSSISNLGGRESLEIAVKRLLVCHFSFVINPSVLNDRDLYIPNSEALLSDLSEP